MFGNKESDTIRMTVRVCGVSIGPPWMDDEKTSLEKGIRLYAFGSCGTYPR